MSLTVLPGNLVRSVAMGWVLALSAPPILADNLFGAIAYSRDQGSYGHATDYDSRAEAEAAALEACDESDCVVELWFKNGYGALAEGDDGFGTGWGRYRQEAQSHALRVCQKYTENCDITLTVGTE